MCALYIRRLEFAHIPVPTARPLASSHGRAGHNLATRPCSCHEEGASLAFIFFLSMTTKMLSMLILSLSTMKAGSAATQDPCISI